jgi:hypothetical protein
MEKEKAGGGAKFGHINQKGKKTPTKPAEPTPLRCYTYLFITPIITNNPFRKSTYL